MGILRRAIASLSVVAILSSLVITTTVFAANDVPEDHWSHSYVTQLIDLGVVNDSDNYFPNRAIIRAEVAKMAVNMFGLEGDALCSDMFSDCEAGAWYDGFMGIAVQHGVYTGDEGGETVRPGDGIIRAELAAVLGRVADTPAVSMAGSDVFADVEAGAWFDDYMGWAYCYGIIGGYADGTAGPGNPATRAEFAKMLVKASEGTLIAECSEVSGDDDDDDDDVVGDDDDDDDVVLGDGTLSIELSDDTPASRNIPQDAASISFTRVSFEAIGDDVVVDSITVSRNGLGDEDDFDDIWFATTDGVRVSASRNLNRDDIVVLTFAGGWEIEGGETVELDILGELESATAGTQHAFGIVSEDDVVSNAQDVDGDFPIFGDEMEVAAYSIGTLGFVVNGSGKTVDVGDLNTELAEFKLVDESDSNNTDVLVRAFSLELNGSADNDNLTNLALYQNSERVSEFVEPVGDFVTFPFLDGGFLMEDGDSRVFEVRGDVIGGSDAETIVFALDESSDIVSEIPGLGMFSPRVVNSATPTTSLTSASNVSLNTYTINAGDLSFAKDPSSRQNQTVAPDTDDFDMLTVRLTLDQEVEIKSLGFSVNLNDAGSAYGTAALALTGAGVSFDDFRLVRHDVDEPYTDGTTVASESSATSDTTAQVAVTFGDDYILGPGIHLITFVSDVLSTATANDVYSVDYDGSGEVTAEYTQSSDSVASGDITGGTFTGAEFTVGTATVDFSRTDDNVANEPLIQGSNDRLMMELVVDNNDVEDVEITDLTFGQSGTLVDASQVSNCLLKDEEGNSISDTEDYTDPDSAVASDATMTFDDLEIMIKQSKQATFTLHCDISNGIADAATLTVELDSVEAEDEDGDDATATEGGATLSSANPLSSVSFLTSTGGTLTIEIDSSSKKEDILVGGDELIEYSIASFEFNADDDDMVLKEFSVFFTDDGLSSRMKKAFLRDEDGNLLDDTSVTDKGAHSAAAFNISQADRPEFEADSVTTLYVSATFNDITELADTGKTVIAYVDNSLMNSTENNVEVVSVSTGQDLATANITFSGTDITNSFLANAVVEDADADNTLPVVYTLTADPAGQIQIGDNLIVTSNAGILADGAATVTNISGTAITIAKSESYNAVATDDLFFGSDIESVDDADSANVRVLTIGQGHGFEVDDVIKDGAYVYDSGSAEDDGLTVTAVSSTTITVEIDDYAVALDGGDNLWDEDTAANDFIKYDLATNADADPDDGELDDATETRINSAEKMLFAAQADFETVALKDSVLGFSAEEIYRFKVSSLGGKLELARLTFEVSQTDTIATTFELREVDDDGDVIESTTYATSRASSGAWEAEAACAADAATCVFDTGADASALQFVVGEAVNVVDDVAATNFGIGTITALGDASGTDDGATVTWAGDRAGIIADTSGVTTTVRVGEASSGSTEINSGLVVMNISTSDRIEIGEGKSKTFELRATTVEQGDLEDNSLSVRMVRDAARPSDNATAEFTATRLEADLIEAGSRVIWSDEPKLSSHTRSTADYHNGYLVEGLATASSTLSD
jgi:hypothetical protein